MITIKAASPASTSFPSSHRPTVDTPAPYFPLNPNGTSRLLQSVPFLIETQRQTAYRHVQQLQELMSTGPADAHYELDLRIARDTVRGDMKKLARLLRELQGDTAEKRATWRRAALGLSIPALLWNREAVRLLSSDATRGPATVAAPALLGQVAKKEAAPLVAARLERQLAEVYDIGEGDDGEKVLVFLESWEWKALQSL